MSIKRCLGGLDIFLSERVPSNGDKVAVQLNRGPTSESDAKWKKKKTQKETPTKQNNKHTKSDKVDQSLRGSISMKCPYKAKIEAESRLVFVKGIKGDCKWAWGFFWGAIQT